MDRKLRRLWCTLRIGLGVLFLVSGADKFSNLLTYWPMYMSDTFAQLSPLSAQHFLYIAGAIEALAGLAILLGPVRIGAYLATAWMLCVCVNLVTAGLYDLAVRDVAIALAAFTLAQLTEVVPLQRMRPHHVLT